MKNEMCKWTRKGEENEIYFMECKRSAGVCEKGIY